MTDLILNHCLRFVEKKSRSDRIAVSTTARDASSKPTSTTTTIHVSSRRCCRCCRRLVSLNIVNYTRVNTQSMTSRYTMKCMGSIDKALQENAIDQDCGRGQLQ
ncbi:hypothetical protein BLOT_013618 [Blomia tropicalis]|nr:hypothetical protein BLOT_013618 [Blomia tropicalis]